MTIKQRTPLPPLDYLKSRLDYNSETGIFTNKNSGRDYPAPANSKRYLQIKIDNKCYKAHRLAFLWGFGYCPDEVDHKDRNRHNNAISNLRPATPPENAGNRGIEGSGASKYKGVSSCGNMWRALVKNRRDLGLFYTEEEAAYAYNEAILELYGEFALLNELPERVEIRSFPKTKANYPSKFKSKYKGVIVYSQRKKVYYEIKLKSKYVGVAYCEFEAALEYDLAAQRAGWHPCEYNFPPKSLPLALLIEKFSGMSPQHKGLGKPIKSKRPKGVDQ